MVEALKKSDTYCFLVLTLYISRYVVVMHDLAILRWKLYCCHYYYYYFYMLMFLHFISNLFDKNCAYTITVHIC